MFTSFLKSILFPVPKPPWYSSITHKDHLFWIPPSETSSSEYSLPCMIQSPRSDASFFIIWCHGNACDIGSVNTTIEEVSTAFNAHVLAFEYPSYGLCVDAGEPNKQSIDNHAERAYSFVRDILQWPTDRLLIYGHSIGSGTACHLASTMQVGGLILQSPFTSIKDIIRDKISILTGLFNFDYWDNKTTMQNIQCPTLLIHGQNDNLIRPEHSSQLYNSLSHLKEKHLKIIPNEDHNSIPTSVIISHLQHFLREYFPIPQTSLPKIEIPSYLFVPPTTTHKKS